MFAEYSHRISDERLGNEQAVQMTKIQFMEMLSQQSLQI